MVDRATQIRIKSILEGGLRSLCITAYDVILYKFTTKGGDISYKPVQNNVFTTIDLTKGTLFVIELSICF